MRFSLRCWLQIHTLVALATVSGCRAERTQIVVLVDTDYAVPAGIGSIRVSVVRDGAESVRAIPLSGLAEEGCSDVAGAGRFCVPLSFLLVPDSRTSSDSPVEVRIDGVVGADAIAGRSLVNRRARLPFSIGQTLRLPMFLSRTCEAVQCAADETCVEGGRCVAVDQPPGVSVIDPRTGAVLDAGSQDAGLDRDAMDGTITAVDTGADERDASVDGDASDRADVASGASPCATRTCAAIDSITAGSDFSCVRYTRGAVACWGANDVGQLGRGTLEPRAADGSGGSSVVEFVAGVSDARELAAGDAHACVSWMNTGDRGLSCWGRNARGSLGVGAVEGAVARASIVQGFEAHVLPSGLALGQDVTYATASGSVYAWGDNASATIGFSAPATVTRATPFPMVNRWQSASARGRGVCWRDPPTTVCVGSNEGQRFGDSASASGVVARPTALAPRFRMDSLAVGRSFACALTGGAVSCWGENRASGVLGRVPSAADPVLLTEPTAVPLPTSIRAIAVGDDFVLALSGTDRLFCWGSNAEGACATGVQRADGAVEPATVTAHEIVLPPGFSRPIREVVAGDGHACALAADRLPWCWGRNGNAQVAVRVSADPRSRAVVTPQPVFAPTL
jgi:alpha-tubulin suppressor-like RCC1 family protein